MGVRKQISSSSGLRRSVLPYPTQPGGKMGLIPDPFKLSKTPAHIGGRLNRSGPSYGQDTEYVMSHLLGLDGNAISDLVSRGVL